MFAQEKNAKNAMAMWETTISSNQVTVTAARSQSSQPPAVCCLSAEQFEPCANLATARSANSLPIPIARTDNSLFSPLPPRDPRQNLAVGPLV